VVNKYSHRVVNHKFKERETLEILSKYIDETYSQHYGEGKIQATEFIVDSGMGVGFCLGNIIKYAKRFGKKGGFNKVDLLKIVHYAIILYGSLDDKSKDESTRET
jgi:hypothetical protein